MIGPVRSVCLLLPVLCTFSVAADGAAIDRRIQSGVCPGRGPSIEVRVAGIKNSRGSVRVQAYAAKGYLKKGQWIARAEALAKGQLQTVCLTLSEPGRYAIAVRHDANGNGKSDWNDGAGFSRNPRLSLLDRPALEQVSIPVGARPSQTTVIVNYRRGWSIAPLSR